MTSFLSFLTEKPQQQKSPSLQLYTALKSNPVDLGALRCVSEERNGYMGVEWRQRIWPKLLGMSGARRFATMERDDDADRGTDESSGMDTPSELRKRRHRTYVEASSNQDSQEDSKRPASISTSLASPPALQSPTAQHSPRSSSQHKYITTTPSGKQRSQSEQDFIRMQNEQIDKDVERSLWKYTTHETDAERNFKRRQLKRIIVHCLHEREKPLHYFQGLHDICTVFLLVCGEQMAKLLMDQMVLTYLHDSTHETHLEPVLNVLKYIHTLIEFREPRVAQKMEECGVHTGHFALSWVLTWFSHVLEELSLISRLFDIFLSHHPMFVIYVCASYVNQMHKETILSDEEPEFSTFYSLLNRFIVPSEEELESIIEASFSLFEELPPDALIARHATQDEDTGNVSHYYHDAYPFAFCHAKLKPDVKEIHDLTRTYRSLEEEIAEEERRRRAKQERREMLSLQGVVRRTLNSKRLYPTLAGLVSLSILALAVYLFPKSSGR